MKLNHECVRKCLLVLENNIGVANAVDSKKLINALDYDKDESFYALQKLSEGGFIVGGPTVLYPVGGAQKHYAPITDITWKGHEYLDAIRDDKIWKKAKSATSSLKSVSLSVMKDVASHFLTEYIKGNLM
ncbi:hypothetical protein RZ70_00630 [Apilactobacillus kunkeei]|uniref:DUF2513 domain-containing protein n=1 Tax=Apilactobacillus kunkeei TaxID=148814 RepID=UPI0006C17901|nr:DUF2513 domain-containing protein [Apilactobacillus kunkeei]KOY73941.1 hypothetical protein RZ70_00630 [Apilactobacillus kunkeei]